MAQRKGLGKGVDALIPTAESRKSLKQEVEKPKTKVVEKEERIV